MILLPFDIKRQKIEEWDRILINTSCIITYTVVLLGKYTNTHKNTWERILQNTTQREGSIDSISS